MIDVASLHQSSPPWAQISRRSAATIRLYVLPNCRLCKQNRLQFARTQRLATHSILTPLRGFAAFLAYVGEICYLYRMEKVKRTRYNSRLDWLIITIVGVVVVFVVALNMFLGGWMAVLITLPILMIILLGMTCCWYEIDGDRLVVHDLITAKSFPIDKILSVAPTKLWLAAPAASLLHRIEIKFSDPAAVRGARTMLAGNSLIISPVRQKEFIHQLLTINPSIQDKT